MSHEEMIEQAARLACTARPGHDHQPRLDQECAWVLAVCENLADAGLLARPLPTRDEIAEELNGWPIGDGYYQSRVIMAEAREMADAVLALLKGQEA